MIICGMELAGAEVRLALLSGTKDDYQSILARPAKLVLSDDEDSNEVRAFQDTIYAFLRENHVELVAIRKRTKTGEYAGGAVGFKLEGIIQLFGDATISLVSPQSVAASKRRHAPDLPTGFYKYQAGAFDTAFAQLP